ncbi:MAG: hypothetical protein LW717_07455 [Chloroflexaceae bacterium]|nr:hypothetical protein [Chloroflexaceae bacterium]
MTTQSTAQLRLRRSQRIRLLHPLATAFDWRFVVYGLFVVLTILLAFQAPSSVDIAVGSLGDRLFLRSSAGLGAQDADAWYGDRGLMSRSWCAWQAGRVMCAILIKINRQ